MKLDLNRVLGPRGSSVRTSFPSLTDEQRRKFERQAALRVLMGEILDPTPAQLAMWKKKGVFLCPHGTKDWELVELVGASHNLEATDGNKQLDFSGDTEYWDQSGEDEFGRCYHHSLGRLPKTPAGFLKLEEGAGSLFFLPDDAEMEF